MVPSTPSLPSRRLGVIMVVVLLLALLTPLMPTNFASLAGAQDAPSDQLVLLSLLDGPPLPADLKILERYGDAFVLAQVSEQRLAALPPANIYDLLPERTMISLNGWVWDTQQGEPALSDHLRSASDDPYFLVQFYAPVKDEWVKSLEALGVAFLGYHPNNTYIVRMDPALAGKVQAAHAVQWVGHYHPAYRLAPQTDLAKALKADDGRLVVEVRGFPGDDVARLQAELTKPVRSSGAPSPAPPLSSRL